MPNNKDHVNFTLLAIDPGTTESAYVLLRGALPIQFSKAPNAKVRAMLRANAHPGAVLYIENVASYGMPVGQEVFDTVRWIGMFQEAHAHATGLEPELVPRLKIKLHFCGSPRANDSTIRQALIDRYGGKAKAIGTKANPGPLYGVYGDVWSALAIALYAHDTLLLASVV